MRIGISAEISITPLFHCLTRNIYQHCRIIQYTDLAARLNVIPTAHYLVPANR